METVATRPPVLSAVGTLFTMRWCIPRVVAGAVQEGGVLDCRETRPGGKDVGGGGPRTWVHRWEWWGEGRDDRSTWDTYDRRGP